MALENAAELSIGMGEGDEFVECAFDDKSIRFPKELLPTNANTSIKLIFDSYLSFLLVIISYILRVCNDFL
jgi:hypothetical protein